MIFNSTGVSVQLFEMIIQGCWHCGTNPWPGRRHYVPADLEQPETHIHKAVWGTSIQYLEMQFDENQTQKEKAVNCYAK